MTHGAMPAGTKRCVYQKRRSVWPLQTVFWLKSKSSYIFRHTLLLPKWKKMSTKLNLSVLQKRDCLSTINIPLCLLGTIEVTHPKKSVTPFLPPKNEMKLSVSHASTPLLLCITKGIHIWESTSFLYYVKVGIGNSNTMTCTLGRRFLLFHKKWALVNMRRPSR